MVLGALSLCVWCVIGLHSTVWAESSGNESPKQEASLKESAKGESGKEEAALETPRYYNPAPLTTGFIRPIDYGMEDPPAGIKKGPVTLHPLFSTSITYDDNVLGTRSRAERKDFIWEVSPGYELIYRPNPDFTLTHGYKFGWVDYLDDNAKDYLTHNAGLNLQWRNLFVKGLKLEIDEQYRQSGNTGVFENQFASFSRVQGNSVGPTLSYETKRMGFIASYRFGLTDYFSQRNQVGDYHTHTADGMYYYKLSSKIRLYTQYTYESYDFVNSKSGDFDTHTHVAGVRANYRKIDFDFHIGNRRATTDDINKPNRSGGIDLNQYDSDDGLVANLRISAKPTRRLSTYLSASQAFTAGVVTGGAKNTRAEVGVSVICFKKGKFDARALWNHEDRGSGLEQTTQEYGGRFTYRILKTLHGFADYNRSERSTNLDDDDIIINRGQIGIYFRF